MIERLREMLGEGHVVVGFLAAAGGLISYVYRHYGAQKPFDWCRWLLEGVMCGFIGLTVFYGLESIGLPKEAANFAGCVVGCIGVNASTDLLKSVIQKKIN